MGLSPSAQGRGERSGGSFVADFVSRRKGGWKEEEGEGRGAISPFFAREGARMRWKLNCLPPRAEQPHKKKGEGMRGKTAQGGRKLKV